MFLDPSTGSGQAFDLTPSPLERLRREAAQRADYIDLSDSNFTTNGFIFPPDILHEAADAYWRTRRYAPHPKGDPRAREAIAAYYAQRTPPLAVSPDHIFITASTSEAYSLLFTLLTSPGDNVLAPIPSYPLFAHLAAMHHITLNAYRTDHAEIPNFKSSPCADVAQGIIPNPKFQQARTRAILLISPHNPTGQVITEKSQIPTSNVEGSTLNVQPSTFNLQLPLIADEVFCEFPFAVSHVPPIGGVFPDATVFHLNGISKMFALPDLKLGWIAISGPNADEYIEPLELLNDTLLSANSLTQFMLPTLFARGMEFTHAMRATIQRNLRMAIDALQTIERVRVAPPMGGTYLFPEILDCNDEEALVARLLRVGVFAHPGYFYDEERGAHLMISGLLAEERLLEGIERLGSVLRYE